MRYVPYNICVLLCIVKGGVMRCAGGKCRHAAFFYAMHTNAHKWHWAHREQLFSMCPCIWPCVPLSSACVDQRRSTQLNAPDVKKPLEMSILQQWKNVQIYEIKKLHLLS